MKENIAICYLLLCYGSLMASLSPTRDNHHPEFSIYHPRISLYSYTYFLFLRVFHILKHSISYPKLSGKPRHGNNVNYLKYKRQASWIHCYTFKSHITQYMDSKACMALMFSKTEALQRRVKNIHIYVLPFSIRAKPKQLSA